MSEEILILSIDAATPERSVAVTRGARLLALQRCDVKNSGASSVLSDVDAALKTAGVKINDVELFAATSGPGSFTGLRAGLATVKAFGDTLRRPVVGVPTLHAIAYAARPSETLVAFAPAGRGEVFAQTLSVNDVGEVTELSKPSHVAPSTLAAEVARAGGHVKWVGVGGGELFESLKAAAESFGVAILEGGDVEGLRAGRGWTFVPPVGKLAEHVAAIALRKFRAGEVEEASELRALYVRASDAELKEKCPASK
ncbi:MAG TPA: tRNA (adenosine(37)-N6)-threonylcarbamoyltransferase complex dimerization subunit type 1 TsaB [Pyrinomonadaceae bacterium]|nr:tRNA (adenosine(37)-N6)-threonylcarbamoyltransferase complex dimerization subunit type 1 TsaB [Pyrinomonadaceae bacterium]